MMFSCSIYSLVFHFPVQPDCLSFPAILSSVVSFCLSAGFIFIGMIARLLSINAFDLY